MPALHEKARRRTHADLHRGQRRDRGATGFVLLLALAGSMLPTVLAKAAHAAKADDPTPLEALVESYRELAWYEDRGTVEITRFARGDQRTERWSFSTRAAPPDGFRLHLEPEGSTGPSGESGTDGPLEIWHRDGQLVRYDHATETWAEVPSVAGALPSPPSGSDLAAALQIPRWLAGDAPPWADQLAVEPGQPCGDGSEGLCRMLSAYTGEGRIRLWLHPTGDSNTGGPEAGKPDGGKKRSRFSQVRRLELERESDTAEHVWIRVLHEVQAARRTPAPRPEELATLRFEPPAGARQGRHAPATGTGTGGPPSIPAGVEPVEVYSEEIEVSLVSTSVRVLDRHGRPVPDLTPEDFRAWVDDTEVSITAVDWVRPDQPWSEELEAQLAPEEWQEMGLIRPDPGQLVVIFVQSDFNAHRIKGFLSFLPNVRSLLRTLAPEDRVAVVAFSSHLNLWQDFTRDRDAAYDAVEEAVRFGAVPEHTGPAEAGAPSLAEHFDFVEAKKAAKVEAGLRVTAQALEALSQARPELAAEEKSMIFLGWGVGERTSFGITENRHELSPALESLSRSRTSVHVLDITPYEVERAAGGVGPTHSLETGLRNLATRTGGTFARTYNFPGQAWKGLVQAVSGYYLLVIDGAGIPPGGGLLTVALAERRGRLLVHRPLRIVARGTSPGASPGEGSPP